MKVVIVGGVAGGASAAARIRRLDEHAQIIMIERSGYVSYANCGPAVIHFSAETLSINIYLAVVLLMGLEPTTYRLKAGYSTN